MVHAEHLVKQLIRDRRKRRGLTQGELADKLGVARNTIIRWEKGDPKGKPDEESRRRLAKILGGSASEYEWTESDWHKADDLEQKRIQARAYIRKLFEGEDL